MEMRVNFEITHISYWQNSMRELFRLKDRKIHFINWKSINQTSDVVFPLAHSQKLITDLAYMRNKYCFFFASDHSTFSVKNSFHFFFINITPREWDDNNKNKSIAGKKSREKNRLSIRGKFRNMSDWADLVVARLSRCSGYECVNFSSWLFSTSTSISHTGDIRFLIEM